MQAPLAQLPWYHHLALLDKLDKPADRLWYAAKAVEFGWSRDILALQIDSALHLRQGNAIANFKAALSPPQSNLAQQITNPKDTGASNDVGTLQILEGPQSGQARWVCPPGSLARLPQHHVYARLANGTVTKTAVWLEAKFHESVPSPERVETDDLAAAVSLLRSEDQDVATLQADEPSRYWGDGPLAVPEAINLFVYPSLWRPLLQRHLAQLMVERPDLRPELQSLPLVAQQPEGV